MLTRKRCGGLSGQVPLVRGRASEGLLEGRREIARQREQRQVQRHVQLADALRDGCARRGSELGSICGGTSSSGCQTRQLTVSLITTSASTPAAPHRTSIVPWDWSANDSVLLPCGDV
jgi:hypothetical protein